MDKAEVIECAEKLKKNCEENCNYDSRLGCDCPFSVAFNNGYLCGIYGHPSDWEVQKNGRDNN